MDNKIKNNLCDTLDLIAGEIEKASDLIAAGRPKDANNILVFVEPRLLVLRSELWKQI